MLFTESVDMSTAAGTKRTVDAGIRTAEKSRISPEIGLSVYVVFTSIRWTLKALEKARKMAGPVGAKVVVVAVQVVPYPLPLDTPPVSMEFIVRQFEKKAGEFPERTQISAYLCRDPMEALKRVLDPDNPVVVGVEKKWFPTRDERLARRLRRAGYEVTLVSEE